MTPKPNIAFIGKAGSGKDTAAELLIETLGYARIAFADALKDVCEELWGDEARKDRDKLQKLGMAVREIEPDTWVNLALAKLPITGPHGTVRPIAVTDCRLHNEAWALKGEGFIIIRILADRNDRINRLRTNGKLGPSGWEDHVSETELDEWPEDYRVHNLGSKADLIDELARTIALETGTVAP